MKLYDWSSERHRNAFTDLGTNKVYVVFQIPYRFTGFEKSLDEFKQ